MSHIVEVQHDGITIYVEASDTEAGLATSRIPEMLDKETVARRITQTLQTYSTLVVQSYLNDDSAPKPSKVVVEFGVQIGVEGTVYVAKGTGQANVKVTAEWENLT